MMTNFFVDNVDSKEKKTFDDFNKIDFNVEENIFGPDSDYIYDDKDVVDLTTNTNKKIEETLEEKFNKTIIGMDLGKF